MDIDSPTTPPSPDQIALAAPSPTASDEETLERVGVVAVLWRLAVVVMAAALSLFYIVLIFAYLWRPALPDESQTHASASLFAFYVDTFTFHGGLAVMALAALLALGRRWRLVAASLPALIYGVGPYIVTYLPHAPPTMATEPVRLMSANLYGANGAKADLVEEIAVADPDLLFLQEYNEQWDRAFKARIGDRYPHIATIPRTDFFGMAIFSKLPFEGEGAVRLNLADTRVPCMEVMIKIGDRPVTFFNIHLIPPKGVACYKGQSDQLADLLGIAAAKNGPVVFAGDFNFTEGSWFGEQVVQSGMRTCDALAGRGHRSTWPAHGLLEYLPGVRIDHIYLSPELTCVSTYTGVGPGSDHRPIIAEIGLAE